MPTLSRYSATGHLGWSLSAVWSRWVCTTELKAGTWAVLAQLNDCYPAVVDDFGNLVRVPA